MDWRFYCCICLGYLLFKLVFSSRSKTETSAYYFKDLAVRINIDVLNDAMGIDGGKSRVTSFLAILPCDE
ncbi:MAG: hypothetical protein ABGX68_05530 [Methylococcales bacterium]|jgi:hypothetical protein|nr:hypothetical protein [Methylococcaceae bacterium]